MCRNLSLALAVILGILVQSMSTLGDDGQPASTVGERLVTITDVVLQHHIDPPARQQMILSAAKALYRSSEQPIPRGLSDRISRLSTSQQIIEYLNEIAAQFKKPEGAETDAETILENGLLEPIPGGSVLIEVQDDKIQRQLIANRYVGIGIVLTMNQEKIPQVPQVLYDGPAWKAGMKHGDLILEVDSRSTASKDLETVLKELRGEDGSEVTVVVRQPDSQESRTLTMKRARVFIPTIEGFRKISDAETQYMADVENSIALLRVRSIGPSTLHELRQIESKLKEQNVRGIILDLRFGGGVLHDVVMFADAFLEQGPIGHIRSPERVESFEATPGSLFQNIPVAVLIGPFSAPDRVFLTAALQDQGRAMVVGMSPRGEAFVNSILPLPNRTEQLRLAIAVMQRGDGTPLNGPDPRPAMVQVGDEDPESPKKRPGVIVPDHIVNVGPGPESLAGSAAPSAPPEDLILNRAIEIMRGAIQPANTQPEAAAEAGE